MSYRSCELREAQFRMLYILEEVDRICKKHKISYWVDSGTLLGSIRHRGFIPWDDDLDIGMLREDYVKFLDVVSKELKDEYFCQTPLSDKYAEAPWAKIRDNNSKINFDNGVKEHSGIFIDIFPYDTLSKKDKVFKFSINGIMKLKAFTKFKFKKPYIFNFPRNIIVSLLKAIGVLYNIIPYRKFIKKSYKLANKKKDHSHDEINYGIEVPWSINLHKKDVFPLKYYDFEHIKVPVPNEYEKILCRLYGDWTELPREEERNPSHSSKISIKIEKNNAI